MDTICYISICYIYQQIETKLLEISLFAIDVGGFYPIAGDP